MVKENNDKKLGLVNENQIINDGNFNPLAIDSDITVGEISDFLETKKEHSYHKLAEDEIDSELSYINLTPNRYARKFDYLKKRLKFTKESYRSQCYGTVYCSKCGCELDKKNFCLITTNKTFAEYQKQVSG